VASPSASDLLLFEGGQTTLPGWILVIVEGRHAERFLNSQLTSDVNGLAVGSSQQTALLDRGGRLQSFGFLHRRSDRFELLLPAVAAVPTLQQLEKYVIADDVRLEIVESARIRLALGAEAVRLAAREGNERFFPIEIFGSRGFITWGDGELDLPIVADEDLETRRVLTGLPRWGEEVTEGMLIHETTLIGSAVSADKGCYLGQETVAKVASGRGAARAPMLLEVLSDDIDGAELVGREFSSDLAERSGKGLSAARWGGTAFLQAAVVRELRVAGREIDCRVEGGPVVRVRVHALPYLDTPTPEDWAKQIELRAVEAFADDREDEAIELYERAIAVCPDFADAYEGLGVILGRHGRYDEAIELMQRLLEVDPMSVMAHTNLSLYYNQQGRIEEAEREAGEATRAKMRRESEAVRDAGNGSDADSLSADRERRAGMFRQVLELDPDDALGNFGLGELLAEEGRFEEAVFYLERALATDPRYSAALLALGRAHEGADDLAAAREIYLRGVDVAAAKGDLATANKMQERLVELEAVSRKSQMGRSDLLSAQTLKR
jgi:folate-binding protein YgfZ